MMIIVLIFGLPAIILAFSVCLGIARYKEKNLYPERSFKSSEKKAELIALTGYAPVN